MQKFIYDNWVAVMDDKRNHWLVLFMTQTQGI